MNTRVKRLEKLERQSPGGERVWAFVDSTAEAEALQRRYPTAELHLYRWLSEDEDE